MDKERSKKVICLLTNILNVKSGEAVDNCRTVCKVLEIYK